MFGATHRNQRLKFLPLTLYRLRKLQQQLHNLQTALTHWLHDICIMKTINKVTNYNLQVSIQLNR